MPPCFGAPPALPPSDLPLGDNAVPLGTQAGVAWRGGVVAPPLLPLPPSHRCRPQARASASVASPLRRLSEVLWLLVMFLLYSSLLPLAICNARCWSLVLVGDALLVVLRLALLSSVKVLD
jgi:hypothetical protein